MFVTPVHAFSSLKRYFKSSVYETIQMMCSFKLQNYMGSNAYAAAYYLRMFLCLTIYDAKKKSKPDLVCIVTSVNIECGIRQNDYFRKKI